MLNLARTARTRPLGVLHPAFSLLQQVRDLLLEKLPADAHLRASGRLCVSLTRLDGRNLLVSQFDSREELVQVDKMSWSSSRSQVNPSLCAAGSAVQLLLPRLLRLRPSILPWRGEDAPSQ